MLTFLFDPDTALKTLHALEEQWGGTPKERLDRKYAAYSAQYGGGTPIPDDDEVKDAEDEAKQSETEEVEASPAPDPTPSPRTASPRSAVTAGPATPPQATTTPPQFQSPAPSPIPSPALPVGTRPLTP